MLHVANGRESGTVPPNAPIFAHGVVAKSGSSRSIAFPTVCISSPAAGYQMKRKIVAQLSQLDGTPARPYHLLDWHQEFFPLIYEMEQQVIDYAGEFDSSDDREILDAVTLLRHTYRTESNGVIYEHISPNPRVQALSRKLAACVEEIRGSPGEGVGPLSLDSILRLLNCLIFDIQFHLEEVRSRGTYLDFITKNHPEVTRHRPSQVVEVACR